MGSEAGFFSDNYFDMLPGETRIIHLETEISADDLNEALTVRTLDDAF
jgi:beta-mannosidase